jgi:hypothetical protein
MMSAAAGELRRWPCLLTVEVLHECNFRKHLGKPGRERRVAIRQGGVGGSPERLDYLGTETGEPGKRFGDGGNGDALAKRGRDRGSGGEYMRLVAPAAAKSPLTM